jgi:uncharacterized protein YcbX
MRIGTVYGLWRYPIKSMRGEACTTLTLTSRGVVGDRAYALRDLTTGKIASAKHPRMWGALLTCCASMLVPPESGTSLLELQIILPDGRTVVTGRDPVDALLSTVFGRMVALVSDSPVAAEIERYWPDVDGLAFRDTVTSGPIGLGAPGNPFVDYAPVHLLTTASLARLHALYPAGHIDVRRFRPNLVVESAGSEAEFVENDWVGRTLLIGDGVRLQVSDPTPRCVVPTLPQADLPQDVGILRAVAAHNRPPIPALGGVLQPSLGVYARVEQPGLVRRGDFICLIK